VDTPLRSMAPKSCKQPKAAVRNPQAEPQARSPHAARPESPDGEGPAKRRRTEPAAEAPASLVWHTLPLHTGHRICVPDYLEMQAGDRVLGRGAYGLVVAATDQRTGDKVAVKMIENAFSDAETAKVSAACAVCVRARCQVSMPGAPQRCA